METMGSISPPRRAAGGALKRIALCVTALALLAAVFSSTASAASPDTIGVAVSNASPATGTPITITFSGFDSTYTDSDGNSETPWLYALVRPNNGVPCQATYGADRQEAATDNATVFYNGNDDYNGDDVGAGNYSEAVSYTPSSGSYIICAWLETDSQDSASSGDVASQVVEATANGSFSAMNTDTLSASLSTSTTEVNQPMTLTFSGTDTPYDGSGDTPFLYAVARPDNGVPCQATFGADQQVTASDNATVLFDGNDDYDDEDVTDGNFSYPVTFTPTTSGSYTICAWLETDGSDQSSSGDVASQVVTATATATLSAPAPQPVTNPTTPTVTTAPACVVPRSAGLTLAAVKARIRASHCTVGAIYHVKTRFVRRGRVIRLGAKAGRRLKHGARVAIIVSLG